MNKKIKKNIKKAKKILKKSVKSAPKRVVSGRRKITVKPAKMAKSIKKREMVLGSPEEKKEVLAEAMPLNPAPVPVFAAPKGKIQVVKVESPEYLLAVSKKPDSFSPQVTAEPAEKTDILPQIQAISSDFFSDQVPVYAPSFALNPPPARKPKKMRVDFIAKEISKKPAGKANFFISRFFSRFRRRASAEGARADDFEDFYEDIFAPPDYVRFFGLFIPYNWHKKVAVFAVLAVILVLPLQAFSYYQNLIDTKERILVATDLAIENLKSGGQAASEFDLSRASDQFDQAKSNFLSAQKEISQLNSLTTEIIKIVPGQAGALESGAALLQAGKIIAETAQILVTSGENLLKGNDFTNYFQSLINFKLSLEQAKEKFSQAKLLIGQVNPNDLPPNHREAFVKAQAYLAPIEKGLDDVYAIDCALLKALGNDQWRRYMLIFVNNNELRAGGGFMGSFALLDIDRGQIKKIDIPGGGTYDIQGQLVPKVISPEPLHLINARWEFQDSNWWPDYPTSAKKMQWFYQNAGGPSVDGVVTVTSTMMEKLLEIFGPIPMPEYGREITSQNFVEETQKIVELEYDKKENRPKQFLADMAPKLMAKIFNASGPEMEKLFNVLKNGLNERQILIYFNDPKIENVIAEFGWSGKMRQTDGDFLAVVHSNLAGGKSDRVIKDTLRHEAEIQPDGSIIDTVRLIRRHTGVPGENIFTGVQNNSYIRFYVPQGSILLEAEGFQKPEDKLFEAPKPEYEADLDLISIESQHLKDEKSGTEIYTESGKTVFGNWLMLKAGETKEVMIKYKLPFNLSLAGEKTFYYSLLAQKQAGTLGAQLKSSLILNGNLKPLAKFPNDLPGTTEGVSFDAGLTTDQFYGVVLVKD